MSTRRRPWGPFVVGLLITFLSGWATFGAFQLPGAWALIAGVPLLLVAVLFLLASCWGLLNDKG